MEARGRGRVQTNQENPAKVENVASFLPKQQQQQQPPRQQCEKEPADSGAKLEVGDQEEEDEEVEKEKFGARKGEDCKFAHRPSAGGSQSASCLARPAGEFCQASLTRAQQAMTVTGGKVRPEVERELKEETVTLGAKTKAAVAEMQQSLDEINAAALHEMSSEAATSRTTATKPEASSKAQEVERCSLETTTASPLSSSSSSFAAIGTQRKSESERIKGDGDNNSKNKQKLKLEEESELQHQQKPSEASNSEVRTSKTTELEPKPKPKSELESESKSKVEAVCHLTARTSNNQCALHKSSNYPIAASISSPSPSSTQSSSSHDQAAAAKICLRLTPISVPNKTTVSDNDDNQVEQQQQQQQKQQQQAALTGPKGSSKKQDENQPTMVISENKLSYSEKTAATKTTHNPSRVGDSSFRKQSAGKQSIKRLKWRHRRFNPEKFGPTWPIAKRTLNDNSSFGDCEDISSAHLSGRLFHFTNSSNISASSGGSSSDKSNLQKRRQMLPKRSNQQTSRSEQDDTETITTTTTCLEDFLNSEQVVWQREQIISELATCTNSGYNHKRPFAQPFERPTAGWIYNAIGAERISKRTTTPPRSLKGKLLI